jgi:hypothetical protein
MNQIIQRPKISKKLFSENFVYIVNTKAIIKQPTEYTIPNFEFMALIYQICFINQLIK